MLNAMNSLTHRMTNIETIAEKTLRRFNKLDDQMATLLQASQQYLRVRTVKKLK